MNYCKVLVNISMQVILLYRAWIALCDSTSYRILETVLSWYGSWVIPSSFLFSLLVFIFYHHMG